MTVNLKNSSDCAFFVDLQVKNNNFEVTNPPSESQINSAFHLSYREGVIPANSEIQVDITFVPVEVINFDLKLIVTAKERMPKKLPSTSTLKSQGQDPSMKSEMKIKAEGNYPLLEIIDIRNDTLSVAALWENFQISKINHEL